MRDSLLKEAYELVVCKWETIINLLETTSDTPKNIDIKVCSMPRFEHFFAGCAYCQLFRWKQNESQLYCAECPLNTGITCLENSHPYKKFAFSKEENDHVLALRYAKELLKLIKKTKPNGNI